MRGNVAGQRTPSRHSSERQQKQQPPRLDERETPGPFSEPSSRPSDGNLPLTGGGENPSPTHALLEPKIIKTYSSVLSTLVIFRPSNSSIATRLSPATKFKRVRQPQQTKQKNNCAAASRPSISNTNGSRVCHRVLQPQKTPFIRRRSREYTCLAS